MKSNFLVLWMLPGALAFTALSAPPKPADSMHDKNREKMWADLKLTPDQKSKLKALHEQMMEAHRQTFDQMKAVREKIKAELLKAQPSKQLLDGYAAQIGDFHKQIAGKRIDHLLQVKALLTPEQFSKLLSREPPGGPDGKRPWMGKPCKQGREMDKGHQHENEGGPGEMEE